MTTYYSPLWKDDEGNVMLIPTPNSRFTSKEGAQEYADKIAFGVLEFYSLVPSGIYRFEIEEDGRICFPHVQGCAPEIIILAVAGPAFDEAEANTETIQ